MPDELSYKPSTFYFREAIRSARRRAEVADLALHLVREHEMLREWVRDHGLVPPKWFISPLERSVKQAAPSGLVCPFSTIKAESGKAE